MTKKRILPVCFHALLLSIFFAVVQPANIYAGEKDITIPFTKNYDNVTLTIKMESSGEYTGVLTAPDGTTYDCSVVDATTLTCNIEKVVAGDWSLNISDEYQDAIPKATVSMSQRKVNETDVVDSNNITVGKDIVGLKTYFVDNSVVIEWTDDTIGKVSIQIVDLDTNETLANSSTDTKKFTCDLKDTTKRISINIVPSSSSNVSSATTTYTYDVDNHPDAVVTFPTEDMINVDYVTATVTAGRAYAADVYVDDSEVISGESIPQGESSFKIPIEEDGLHTIKFYVVDDDGNMRSTCMDVTKDSIAPELELDAKYDNLQTTSDTYTISGKVTGQTSFTINDTDVTPTSDGHFSYDATLHEGANKLDLVAKDVAGNESSYSITINMEHPKKTLTVRQAIEYLAILIILIVFIIKNRKKRNKKATTQPLSDAGTESTEDIDSNSDNVTPAKSSTKRHLHVGFKDDIPASLPKFKNPHVKTLKKADKDVSASSFSLRDFIPYLFVVGVMVCLLNFMVSIGSIKSGSMEPTLMTGDIVIGNRLAYKVRQPQTGDIIFFKFGKDVYCKRIIGVAGDNVAFRDGYVYLNGERLDESLYLDEDIETNCTETFAVPENCVFVLGDNRELSYDSRFWDNPYIPINDIISRELIDFNNILR